MLSPEILERLALLNRQVPLPRAAAGRDSQLRNDVREKVGSGDPTYSDAPAVLPGVQLETPWGCCWSTERRLVEVAPRVGRELRSVTEGDAYVAIASDAHPELRALLAALPESALFLDLETCGFAGAMIFLVGLVRATSDGLTLTQLVARNYAEEKALLQALWQIASDHELLVTFNGKSFDWPCVHDRSTVHHLGRDDRYLPDANTSRAEPIVAAMDRTHRRPQLQHVDLLHHARRKWKAALPNCRLQTLERYLCGRRRVQDISGAAIPDAYHQFVRAQNPLVMHSILHHNALDLVTLVQLALRVCREEAAGSDDTCG